MLFRKQKRIKSFEYFNRYFTYAIGVNDISDQCVIRSLRSSNITEEAMDDLLKTNPSKTLQKMSDNIEVITDTKGFCVNLILAAEKIVDERGKGIFSLSIVEKSLFTIDDLLQKRSSNLLTIYEDILRCCRKLSTLTYAIRQVDTRANKEDGGRLVLSDEEFAGYKKVAVSVIKKAIKNKKLPVENYDSSDYQLYEYLHKFEGHTGSINKYMKSMVRTGTQAVDFISQFLSKYSNMTSNKIFHVDLLDNDSATYKFWFDSKFDAPYLYRLISSDESYKKYRGIKQENIVYFDRRDLGQAEISMVGNEKADEFRAVIAQQFIYLYELRD